MVLGGLEIALAIVSTGFTMLSTWGQFRKLDGVREMKKALQEHIKTAPVADKSRADVLLRHLSRAYVIVPALKRHVATRAAIAVGAMAGGGAIVPLDFPGYVFNRPVIEPPDVFIIAAQIVLPLLLHWNRLLTTTERKFLVHFAELETLYYNWYVAPAIEDFNLASEGSAIAKEAKAAYENELIVLEKAAARATTARPEPT